MSNRSVTINTVAELNLIVEALQAAQVERIKAAQRLTDQGVPMRALEAKVAATAKLLDRLRVGWKQPDVVPAELQPRPWKRRLP